MKIIVTGTCGNSPKNKFVEDFTTALLENDGAFLNEYKDDDVDIPNLIKIQECGTVEYIYAISHGRAGNLLCKCLDNGIYFSFNYQFTNTKGEKIKEVIVTSEMIDVK
ncbi:MAG: hypothetical protein GX666_07630 [Tissierellia bacterium]|nr:hypothetical protein [Tissierellia bacterium]